LIHQPAERPNQNRYCFTFYQTKIMSESETIKVQIRELVMQILQVDGATVELADDTPFFGTEEHPGVIQDSLAILEIASQIAETFGLMPSDLGEEAFQNLNTLSEHVSTKVKELELV
jgi:acyl carrier protein